MARRPLRSELGADDDMRGFFWTNCFDPVFRADNVGAEIDHAELWHLKSFLGLHIAVWADNDFLDLRRSERGTRSDKRPTKLRYPAPTSPLSWKLANPFLMRWLWAGLRIFHDQPAGGPLASGGRFDCAFAVIAPGRRSP